MHSKAVAALFACLALVLVPAAYADGTGSSTMGGGHRACCPPHPDQKGAPFSVEAVETADDGTATGHYNINSTNRGPLDFKGDVTSMLVSGNRSLVCGVVREAADPDQVGTGFAVAFTDNGNPSDPLPDFVSLTNVFIPPIHTQAECLANIFLFLPPVTLPMTEGNVSVVDTGA